MSQANIDGSRARTEGENMYMLKPKIITATIVLMLNWGVVQAQTGLAPPQLGEETKGAPATNEENSLVTTNLPQDEESSKEVLEDQQGNLFGDTIVKESKRESGQRYLIEFESSLGGKQYMEETDSDGKIESTSNDIEETPNLPKWKIGSW